MATTTYEGSNMENRYQSLANKWKNQANESNNEHEQIWLYACVADLESLINQQLNKANTADTKKRG